MAKKSASPKRSAGKRSANAPDAFRGFSLQATRFLYHLMKAGSDDVVSLEYFEDVGVEKADGHRLAEQDKSYLSSNPLADRSVVLWKTIRNWVEAARSGTLLPDSTQFVIYAPKATMGAIAAAINGAQTLTQANDAIALARSTLSTRDGLDIAANAKEHVELVFNADQTLIANIFRRIIVETDAESPSEALKALFLEKLIGEESFGVVITWAHGWVKERLDRFLESRQIARLSTKDFHRPLLNFVRTHDRINILRSVAGKPDNTAVANEMEVRDYVRQLRIIDMDDSDVLSAVNDFLSAAIDRTTWSDQGMISAESLDTLESDLLLTWRNKRKRTQIGFADKDEKAQGQLTYIDCLEHTARVDGLDTPTSFIRGSWHALADDLTIGWHPQYQSLVTQTDAAPSGPSREN